MATVMASSSKGSVGGYSNYLKQEEKTDESLIETKDCTTDFARDFQTTKNLYNKTSGVQFHEIVQSFAPKEVSLTQAHDIGKELLKHPKFCEFQVVVVTHKDREHIHNHIIINSVSHINGKKYHQTPNELKQIKEFSNKLCKERNLSFLNLETKAEKYINQKENKILKSGAISKKEELREWVQVAKSHTSTLEGLKSYLKENFDVDTKIQNKNIKFKHPQLENFVNGKKLGADYEKGAFENGISRGKNEEKGRGRTRTIEYPSRNDTGINRENIISKNECVRSGADESREYTTQTNLEQLHQQLQQIRGINQEFNPRKRRELEEEDDRTKSKDREKDNRAESGTRKEDKPIKTEQRDIIKRDRGNGFTR